MTVTPVSESHVGQMQSALIAFAQTFLKMEGLKLDEKNQEKNPKIMMNLPRKKTLLKNLKKIPKIPPFLLLMSEEIAKVMKKNYKKVI